MKTVFAALTLALLLPGAGIAQSTSAPAAGTSKLGGLAGMLGGGIPSVASTGVGNAAGLLGYCVKNNLLSGAGASSVLGSLSGKSGVATSPGYAAGQSGVLQTGQSGTSQLSLDGMKGQVKTQVCNLVLKRAKSFL